MGTSRGLASAWHLMGELMLHVVQGRWTAEQARHWYKSQPWFVGCNFIPAYAINQIEMWQPDTFDLSAIDRELGFAASVGMNAVRIYLHDLIWAADPAGFEERIDCVLEVASRHGIRAMLVFFDSCWHPEPELGQQRIPLTGIHNSGWVQSPGMPALADPAQHPRLQRYVESVVARFAHDNRIIAWDIWNEPDNGALVSLCDHQILTEKAELVRPLLVEAFGWARRQNPSQPLTSGVWLGDWSASHHLSALQNAQLELSDIITFHNYSDVTDFGTRIDWLRVYDRPLICTEFMARPAGSTFEAILPHAHAHDVGVFCWGLVKGKTQTHLPWDSWATPYLDEPAGPWFHDIFHHDGTPHDPLEVAFIRAMTLAAAEKASASIAA